LSDLNCGPYTEVKSHDLFSDNDLTSAEIENTPRWQLEMQSSLVFHAKIMPPLVSSAGKYTKPSKAVPRVSEIATKSTTASFDSWKHTKDTFKFWIKSLIAFLLARLFKPLTFQTRKLKLIAIEQKKRLRQDGNNAHYHY
jgi:hypothetical protein